MAASSAMKPLDFQKNQKNILCNQNSPIGTLKHFNVHSQQHLHYNQGFSLVEVLVGMLVAAIFVSLSMQAIVTAAAFRALANQYDEAYNWIQDDLEKVIYRASQYELTAYPYSSKCNATVASDGFAAGFMNDTTTGLGGAVTMVDTKNFGGKSYSLSRSADYVSSSSPYKLLKLTYTIIPTGGGSPIKTINSEVFLQAALKCY